MLKADILHQLCFDASHNGIMVCNCDGLILVYNKAARRIFNDGDIDLVGKSIQNVRPAAWADMQPIITTGQPQIGRKITLPEATIIANRTPLCDQGKILGVISVFQDVSEHEDIIAKLGTYQRLNQELEAIFESSYDGLYVTDGQANTLRVNKSYERITGLSRESLLGKNMRSLVADQVFDHSVTLEVLRQKKSITFLQQIRGGKSVIVTGTPVFAEDGQISFVVTNVRDITELNELKLALDETRKKSSFYYQSLQEYHEVEHVLKDLVVKSVAMIRVVQKAIKVAKVESSVLISGESGVGKSMLAKLIHRISPRKEQPFVKINCGAIPPALIESELFGYQRGAFTGALSTGKMGLVEAANRGTIFLDEIGELQLDIQVKLLEVIEDRQFKRVGSTQVTKVDAHIIAATNQDLPELVRKGLFREDLYYRLNVVPIIIPPLRQRREDIPALAESIMEKLNRSLPDKKSIDPAVLELLRQYAFPGNVRELLNTIERMMVLSETDILCPSDLPSEIRASLEIEEGGRQTFLKEAIDSYEKKVLLRVLGQSDNLSQAAAQLNIHPTTLWRKMVRYQLTQTTRPLP